LTKKNDLKKEGKIGLRREKRKNGVVFQGKWGKEVREPVSRPEDVRGLLLGGGHRELFRVPAAIVCPVFHGAGKKRLGRREA